MYTRLIVKFSRIRRLLGEIGVTNLPVATFAIDAASAPRQMSKLPVYRFLSGRSARQRIFSASPVLFRERILKATQREWKTNWYSALHYSAVMKYAKIEIEDKTLFV